MHGKHDLVHSFKKSGRIFKDETEFELNFIAGIEILSNEILQKQWVQYLPDFLDSAAKIFIAVIQIAFVFDFQLCSYDGEQRCIELDSSIRTQSHVHCNQTLKMQMSI